MSGVHCERFPDCMELGQNATIPKCGKADCPGNKSWTGLFASAQEVREPVAWRWRNYAGEWRASPNRPPDEIDAEPLYACPSQHAQETSGWEEIANQHYRNEEFYRGLVHQIGNMFGIAARTSDDGSIQDSVIALRVPELVARVLQKLEEIHEIAQDTTARVEQRIDNIVATAGSALQSASPPSRQRSPAEPLIQRWRRRADELQAEALAMETDEETLAYEVDAERLNFCADELFKALFRSQEEGTKT